MLLFSACICTGTSIRLHTSHILLDVRPHKFAAVGESARIPLKLPISLGMTCGWKGVVSAHHWPHALIQDEVFGWSVIENPCVEETSCDFFKVLILH